MSLFSSICNKTALKICCVLISGLLVSGSYAQPPNAGSDQPQPQKESRHRRARPQDPENQDPAQNQNPPAPNQPGQNQPQPGNPPGFAGNQKPGIPQASLEQLLQKAAPAEPVPLNQPDFVTEDQVQLKGTYYKGSASEETAIVILLHNRGGKKDDMQPLAKVLAEKGFAVLVPDLRGHGESVNRSVADYSYGNRPNRRPSNNYIYQNFTAEDYQGMVYYDEALWFTFLRSLHNMKMINARKMFLIGNDFGATVAVNWARVDWDLKPSQGGHLVKGIVLLSPTAEGELGCLDSLTELKKNSGEINFLMAAGGQNPEKKESYELIEKKIIGKNANPNKPKKNFAALLDTEKQGTDLINIVSFGVVDSIMNFMLTKMQSLSSRDQEWKEFKIKN